MGAYLTFPDGVLSYTTLTFDGVEDESWDGANEISDHPVETGSNITDNVRVGLRKVQLSVFTTNEPHQANTFTTPTATVTTITTPDAAVQDASGIYAITSTATVAPVSVAATEWNNNLNLAAGLKGGGSALGGLVGGSAGSLVGTALGGLAAALVAPPGPVTVTVTPQGGLGTAQYKGTTFQTSLLIQSNPDDYVARMYSALEVLRQSATLITVHGSKSYCENMVIASVNMHRAADTGTGAEFIIQLREVRFVTTQTVTAPAATVVHATPPSHKGPQNPTPAPPQVTRSIMRNLALQSVRVGTGMISPDQIAATGLTPDDIALISGGPN